jgi:Holliday junction resolvasome RuvABC endonuclease subunit
MTKVLPKHPRILAVAPSTNGFGYAVIEGQKVFVDWGVKLVEGDKNSGSMKKVGEMIDLYNPQVMVLEDTANKESRRSPRIKALTKLLVVVAEDRSVKVVMFSQKQVRRVLLGDERGTKEALAANIAEQFPEELGFRLPPKRRPWMSEDSRMDIFDAVALALAHYSSGM